MWRCIIQALKVFSRCWFWTLSAVCCLCRLYIPVWRAYARMTLAAPRECSKSTGPRLWRRAWIVLSLGSHFSILMSFSPSQTSLTSTGSPRLLECSPHSLTGGKPVSYLFSSKDLKITLPRLSMLKLYYDIIFLSFTAYQGLQCVLSQWQTSRRCLGDDLKSRKHQTRFGHLFLKKNCLSQGGGLKVLYTFYKVRR